MRVHEWLFRPVKISVLFSFMATMGSHWGSLNSRMTCSDFWDRKIMPTASGDNANDDAWNEIYILERDKELVKEIKVKTNEKGICWWLSVCHALC